MLCIFPGPVGNCKAYLQKMSVEGKLIKSEQSFVNLTTLADWLCNGWPVCQAATKAGIRGTFLLHVSKASTQVLRLGECAVTLRLLAALALSPLHWRSVRFLL